MYKIKLFRNMSGLVAGQSLKQMVTNRDWWKGVFGNMFSTMLGIALTIGIGALVEHYNDKKLAREMMFNIVMACEDNGETIAEFDSLFQKHEEAINKIYDIYYSSNKFNNKPTDKEIDTLRICFDNLHKFNHISYLRKQVDKYFYSAQTMHQFGNADVYSSFATFVQLDQKIFGDIDNLIAQYKSIRTNEASKVFNDGKSDLEALAELIDGHQYTQYLMEIRYAMLPQMKSLYKELFNTLLEVMGATKEEYEDYKKSIDTGIHKTYTPVGGIKIAL